MLVDFEICVPSLTRQHSLILFARLPLGKSSKQRFFGPDVYKIDREIKTMRRPTKLKGNGEAVSPNKCVAPTNSPNSISTKDVYATYLGEDCIAARDVVGRCVVAFDKAIACSTVCGHEASACQRKYCLDRISLHARERRHTAL